MHTNFSKKERPQGKLQGDERGRSKVFIYWVTFSKRFLEIQSSGSTFDTCQINHEQRCTDQTSHTTDCLEVQQQQPSPTHHYPKASLHHLVWLEAQSQPKSADT